MYSLKIEYIVDILTVREAFILKKYMENFIIGDWQYSNGSYEISFEASSQMFPSVKLSFQIFTAQVVLRSVAANQKPGRSVPDQWEGGQCCQIP